MGLAQARPNYIIDDIITRALSSTKPSACCMALAICFSVARRKRVKGWL